MSLEDYEDEAIARIVRKESEWLSQVVTPDMYPRDGEWHICDDCLDPLTKHLRGALEELWNGYMPGPEIHDRMTQLEIWWKHGSCPASYGDEFRASRGRPVDSWVFDRPIVDIGFALVWLEVNVSPLVADNLAKRLVHTVTLLKAVIEEHDEVFSSPLPEPEVAHSLMKGFSDMHVPEDDEFPFGPPGKPEDESKPRPLGPPKPIMRQGPPTGLTVESSQRLRARYQEAQSTLRETLEYVRRLSVVLSAKLKGEQVTRETVVETRVNDPSPSPEWSPIFSPEQLATIFDRSWRMVKDSILPKLGEGKWRPFGDKSYQIALPELPADWKERLDRAAGNGTNPP